MQCVEHEKAVHILCVRSIARIENIQNLQMREVKAEGMT